MHIEFKRVLVNICEDMIRNYTHWAADNHAARLSKPPRCNYTLINITIYILCTELNQVSYQMCDAYMWMELQTQNARPNIQRLLEVQEFRCLLQYEYRLSIGKGLKRVNSGLFYLIQDRREWCKCPAVMVAQTKLQMMKTSRKKESFAKNMSTMLLSFNITLGRVLITTPIIINKTF